MPACWFTVTARLPGEKMRRRRFTTLWCWKNCPRWHGKATDQCPGRSDRGRLLDKHYLRKHGPGAYYGRNKQYLLGMYEEKACRLLCRGRKSENCRKFGFDWLEISIDETEEKLSRLDWTSQQRRPADPTMLKSGVGIKTMCLSGHRKYPTGIIRSPRSSTIAGNHGKAIDLARSGNPADSAGRLRRLLFEGSAQTRKEFIQNLLGGSGYGRPEKA